MATMSRVVVGWQGAITGPGVSVFHVQGTVTDVSGFATFFTSIADRFPVPLTWNIPSSGDLLESTTGVLTGSWTATGGTTVNATAGELFAAPAGALITWRTPTVVNGRRLQGRTFMVPLGAQNNYDAGGALATACVTDLQNAADALILALPGLSVWHRPQAVGDGAIAGVATALVRDRVSVLRSRRD